MTQWLALVGIILILFPFLKRFLVLRWPKRFLNPSPLVLWTAASLVDLGVCGAVVLGSSAPLGGWIFPIVVGILVGLVVFMGCAINWLLEV